MLTFAGQFYVNDGHLNFISVSYFVIFLLFYPAEFSVDTLRLAGWTIITSPCTIIESTLDREHTCSHRVLIPYSYGQVPRGLLHTRARRDTLSKACIDTTPNS